MHGIYVVYTRYIPKIRVPDAASPHLFGAQRFRRPPAQSVRVSRPAYSARLLQPCNAPCILCLSDRQDLGEWESLRGTGYEWVSTTGP